MIDERLAQAHLLFLREEYDEARAIVEDVLQTEPENGAAKDLLDQIIQAQVEIEKEEERNRYGPEGFPLTGRQGCCLAAMLGMAVLVLIFITAITLFTDRGLRALPEILRKLISG